MKRVSALAALMLLCLGSLAQANVFDMDPDPERPTGLKSLEVVSVDDAGNAADTRVMSTDGTSGYGSVSYTYSIGKYEVTAGQYTAFLSAVAKTDTHGLYNPSMWSDSRGCKIQQTGSAGDYSYSVASDYANRPVNYVNFWDACRFTNWLCNGQKTGAQNLTTTEDGAYYLNGYTDIDGRAIQRKAGWQWAVTSEDEWYKAAYYKRGGADAGYWLYPTRSDTAPGNDMNDPLGNNANYYTGSGPHPIDDGKYTTVAGEFGNSASAYGTFDQGGNVWEWNESVPRTDGSYAIRGMRGGSFYMHDADSAPQRDAHLQASDRDDYVPVDEVSYIGFRVVQAVPEPSSLMALASGLAALCGFAVRRRK